jgi:hypothetical protein
MGACGATCGIQKERERDRQMALAAAERAHPGFVWRPEPLGACGGLSNDAIRELGARLEELLPVRAVVRVGDAGCDFLYLLAGVHSPCLCELLDGVAPPPRKGAHPSETYVRIAFSPVGRFATLQEAVFSASLTRAGTAVVEEPVMGVKDRRLQSIVKGLQGALRKARLIVLDMAFVAGPPPVTPAQPAYAQAFAGEPSLWSFLYEGPPPHATRAAVIGRPRRALRARPASLPRSLE